MIMSAAAEQKATEPSMEEILASIRRIISDDQQQSAPVAEKQAPVMPIASPIPEKHSEQLKQEPAAILPQVPSVESPAIRNVVEIQEPEEDVLELSMPEPELIKPEPAIVPEKVAFKVQEPVFSSTAASPSSETHGTAPLINGQTDKLVANSFSSLAHTVLSQNARTLDDVVKDMLHPMLKSWLDDNLPNIVERLVRAEIERVARGGR